MRTMIIFEKYELNENGEVKNINTGKLLKIEEKNDKKIVKLSVEGKTKRVNITELMEQNFPPIVEENVEEIKTRRQSRRYIIKVTELNGTVNEFKTFKDANDFYGLRKDYLNYCIAEKFKHMLTKGNLQLKSVEKVAIRGEE